MVQNVNFSYGVGTRYMPTETAHKQISIKMADELGTVQQSSCEILKNIIWIFQTKNVAQ